MHLNPRRIAPVVMLALLGGVALWYLWNARSVEKNGAITASGTIEATQVKLASEMGGQIKEVLAQEGDAVQAEQVLVRFDDALLQAQLAQAEAALEQAKANYDLVAAGPTEEQRQVAITGAEMEIEAAQQALDDLIENAKLAAAGAQQEIALAENAIDRATQRRENLISGADQPDIDSARAAVVLAKDRLDKAQEDYQPYENKPEDNLVRAALLSKVSAAQNYYDNAVTLLNNLLAGADKIDLGIAEADLAVAKAQLADAERRYAKVKEGPDPDAMALAETRLASAKAHLVQAKADPSPEQMAVAQAQVNSAKAALQVLQTQLTKLTVRAPIDSIVLERSIEPGEVALPSIPLITLAKLDDLAITVYVPEDRYGEIKLSQSAQVTVDSYPGNIFTGTVVQIADQAEFTPRNVQTAEGRRTTVFAVKLAIANPDGKLKPGMPADVTFIQ